MSKFFSNTISTIEELKKEYFKAAMKYHPDHGGDVETMKAINAEYAELQKKLKDKHISFKDETEVYTADTSTTETPEDFINIVNELMKLDGLDIELCGRWLWISGNTKEHKDRLKALGCKWSRNKKMWSWHYAKDGVRSHYKHTPYTIKKIHSVYGVQKFTDTRNSIVQA